MAMRILWPNLPAQLVPVATEAIGPGFETEFRVLPEEPANAQRRLIAASQKNEDWIRHRLLLTPHSAFYTPESLRDNRAFTARTAARFLRDGRLEHCVNKQFL
jgi:phosphoglycerate dehydrogenase-like enzyme